MKKQVIAVAIGLSMFALPAFAHEDKHESAGNKAVEHSNLEKGLKLGLFKHLMRDKMPNSQFVAVGTVESLGANNFVLKASALAHVPTVTNMLVTIKTDANTKIGTPLAAGQTIVVTGSVSGSDILATSIKLIGLRVNKEENHKVSAVGKVTAKTATSVTITNTLANTTKVITSNTDTKVRINGEVKTLADINVGDSGWIKFKMAGTTLVAKIINLFR